LKNEKKKRHIGLWTLLALLLALGALAYAQRANLRAVVQGFSNTSEQLEQQLSEQHQRVQEAAQSHADVTVRDLTEEEKAALRNGTQSRMEIRERLTDPQDNALTESEESEYQKALSQQIAEVYILQAEYNAALEDMAAQAKREYGAKAENEKTAAALIRWASGYVKRATELEKECDAKIDAIAAEILRLTKENGGDTSLADEILYAYANEKSLKKSWYLSEMQKRGLLG